MQTSCASLRIPSICLLLASIGWMGTFDGRLMQAQETNNQGPKAGEKFKSLTVLNGIPADQMGKVMNIASEALGVQCSYCHRGFDFAAEGLPRKDAARKMFAMTLELNKRHFDGEPKVTCATCHRGEAKPSGDVVPFGDRGVRRRPATDPTNTSPLPSVEEVIAKFEQGMGGKERLRNVSARRLTGVRVEPSGKEEPESVHFQHATSYEVKTEYGKTTVVERIVEGRVSKEVNAQTIPLKVDEMAFIRREAAIMAVVNLKDQFQTWNVSRRDRIDDRDAIVIEGKSQEGLEEELIIDVASGRLLARTSQSSTVIGPFRQEVRYKDYQSIDGIEQPMTYVFTMPSIGWTRKVTEAKIDRR